MMRKTGLLRRLTVVGLMWSCGPAGAGDQREHDIELEDYFSIAVITDCAVSPDGTWVAYAEMRWEPPEEKRNTDLWVVSTVTHEPVRLTFETANDHAPQWSPDGRWIYFLSNRRRPGDDKPPFDGKTQVWRIGVEGGEPTAVTRVVDGVNAFDLPADGKALFYSVGQKGYEDDPWQSLRKEYDSLIYGHGVVQYTQIWKLDLVSWRAEKLVDENRVILEFAATPDGGRIAMLTAPTEELITHEGWSRVDIYDAQAKTVTTLPDEQWRREAPSPYGWLLGLAWSIDGTRLSFRVDFDGYPGEVFIARFGDAGHLGTTRLHRDAERYVSGPMEWRPGSQDLCYAADDHARRRVYCARNVGDEGQSETVTMTPGDVVVDDFGFSRDGSSLAAVLGDVTHPPEIYVSRTGVESSNLQRLTRVNPQVETWKLPKIQTVKWTSPDGTEVEGILELPPDYVEGSDPLPLALEIHGGPTAASMLHLRFWIYGRVLLPARGWALLSPNYRGSTGYGDKFLVDLVGHENDRDVADLLSGVDAMVQRGIADPNRMAVMGWSNGGYLTNCLISRTDRFKAASSGAGVFDMVLQWLEEDTPGHVINFMEGFPWNQTEEMQRSSALYNVDKVTTPTLIHVGENDPRVPAGHSRGLFRALHHYVKVPTQLVVYPGEGHGLTTYKHRKAKMAWDLQWLDHWVLGKSSTDESPQPANKVD